MINIIMSHNIIEISDVSNLKSSNFGDGIELLMNTEKLKINESKNYSSDVDLDDLNNLEQELNELTINESLDGDINKHNFNSVLFNDKPNFKEDKNKDFKLSFNNVGDEINETSSIGKSTATFTEDDKKTWDGFQTFNNIPINPDKPITTQPHMTKEELLKEKFKYLRKLEELEKRGEQLSKKYSMDSPLAEMQGEYESIIDEKEKKSSIKFQGSMMMAIVNGIEYLNSKFDPFDVKLDGWSEQITENISDYDEIFGELYEKYKSKAKIAPELKLLFQLGGSVIMVHMTNTLFKSSSMPNMDDILRQNPDLMRSFQQAAVNSISETNPGFSGFMNGIMSDNGANRRGPPEPIKTKETYYENVYSTRGGNNTFGQFNQSSMFNEKSNEDKINFQEIPKYQNNFQSDFQKKPIEQSMRKQRSEMKGPSDISDVLSKLKTKTINIQEEKNNDYSDNNMSTISANDLAELEGNINFSKKPKRRQKSNKNISSMSLDI